MAFPELIASLSYGGSAGQQVFLNNGKAWVCGRNVNGQLGIGSLVNQSTPIALSGTDWQAFVCSSAVTYALKTNGTIWEAGTGGFDLA